MLTLSIIIIVIKKCMNSFKWRSHSACKNGKLLYCSKPLGYSIFYPYRGVDELFQGGIDPEISRGFLLKIEKFPGGYKKK